MNAKAFNAATVALIIAIVALCCPEDTNARSIYARLKNFRSDSRQRRSLKFTSNYETKDVTLERGEFLSETQTVERWNAPFSKNSVNIPDEFKKNRVRVQPQGRETEWMDKSTGGDKAHHLLKFDRQSRNQLSNFPPGYENVPPEIIAQFGGNLPPDVIAHFNQGTQHGAGQPIQPSSHGGSSEPDKSGETIHPGNVGPLAGHPGQTPPPIEAPGPIEGSGKQTSPGDLPPVSFGYFNYQYLLGPPPICGDKKNKTDDEDDDDEEQTTTAAVTTPTPPTDPNIPLTAHQKELILREHNMYRATRQPAASDMRLLSWDDELAWVSQTFTNSCYYRDTVEPRLFHPNGSQISPVIQLRRHSYYHTEIGHSWFAWPKTYGLPQDFVSASITAWDSEKAFYDRESKNCDTICEHFMQLNWAETFKLGCSASWCESADINGVSWPHTILFVCSYTPRGGLANFMAAHDRYEFFDPNLFIEPYKTGRACSLCALDPNDPDQNVEDMRTTEDKCWNNLCANPERDVMIPFIPPARTTTYMWIATPVTTTTPSLINKTTTTEVIDIQFNDKDDYVPSDKDTAVQHVVTHAIFHICWTATLFWIL